MVKILICKVWSLSHRVGRFICIGALVNMTQPAGFFGPQWIQTVEGGLVVNAENVALAKEGGAEAELVPTDVAWLSEEAAAIARSVEDEIETAVQMAEDGEWEPVEHLTRDVVTEEVGR